MSTEEQSQIAALRSEVNVNHREVMVCLRGDPQNFQANPGLLSRVERVEDNLKTIRTVGVWIGTPMLAGTLKILFDMLTSTQ